jgi:hypothetical protein
MSTNKEPQSERPHNPPMSTFVVGSFTNMASVRALAAPTVRSLKSSSDAHSFANVSGGGSSVSS